LTAPQKPRNKKERNNRIFEQTPRHCGRRRMERELKIEGERCGFLSSL